MRNEYLFSSFASELAGKWPFGGIAQVGHPMLFISISFRDAACPHLDYQNPLRSKSLQYRTRVSSSDSGNRGRDRYTALPSLSAKNLPYRHRLEMKVMHSSTLSAGTPAVFVKNPRSARLGPVSSY